MYLGHKMTPGKLRIHTEKSASLRGASHPEAIKELRSFLGMCKSRLSEYELEVHYKKGVKNSVADCISRFTTQNRATGRNEGEISCFRTEEGDEVTTEVEDEEEFCNRRTTRCSTMDCMRSKE